MLDLSLDSANMLYGWSHALLILGTFAVAAGTIGVFGAGGMRERYADERISKNEADTTFAQSAAATANEEAAKANERTKDVELAVEQQRERAAKAEKELLEVQERLKPRRLTLAQRTRLVDDLSRGEKGEIDIKFVTGNT